MNLFTSLLLLLALPHHRAATPPARRLDAAWIATVANASPQHRINDDPRFGPLLLRAFPQRQWFWYEHSRLIPTAELVETFIALPHQQHLDENRFVSIDGCVPHDCLDSGLLWIDTDPDSTQFIAAINSLVGGGPGSHLWLFTSDQRFNWQKPGSNFLVKLRRWLDEHQNVPKYEQHVSIITIVRADGIQSDLAPAELLDPPHLPNPGVQQ